MNTYESPMNIERSTNRVRTGKNLKVHSKNVTTTYVRILASFFFFFFFFFFRRGGVGEGVVAMYNVHCFCNMHSHQCHHMIDHFGSCTT